MTEPLSILMISPNLWLEGRAGVGMPVFHWETAGYARLGHRVTLLLYDPVRSGAGRYEGLAIHRFRVPGPKWGSRAGRRFDGRPWLEYWAPAWCRLRWLTSFTRRAVSAAARLARPGRYDLVYAHTQWSVAAGWIIARRLGLPLVVRYYGADDLGVHASEGHLALKYFDRLPALALPAARIIMTDDGAWQDSIARAFGQRPEKFLLLRNGVDRPARPAAHELSAWRLDRNIAPEALVILHLSRLSPIKRLDRVIAAFARLAARQPRAVLVVTGDGTARPGLESQVRRLGLAGRVRFTGMLDRAQVVRALYASDLLVSAFDTANFSNHLWEAMACGLPAVVADHGPGPRFLHHGQTGWLVGVGAGREGFIADLAAALEHLLDHADLRLRLGQGARDWVHRELPTWEERIAQGAEILRAEVASR